jgi:membrane associated rhomboid family serine protease
MALNELAFELELFINAIQQNVSIFGQIIVILWFINIINWLTGSKLNYFGVRPRKPIGLLGIFFGTFLHKNFNHLFFNTIPLVALGLFMLSFGLDIFFYSSILIMLIEGIIVWVIGRPGLHIGASSLISGYFSFLLVSAYYRPSAASIIIAIITIYYFGSIFLGIFPSEEKTSWEGHLFGVIAGIITYFAHLYNMLMLPGLLWSN